SSARLRCASCGDPRDPHSFPTRRSSDLLSVLAALAAAVGGPLVKLNGTIARLSAMLEHVLHRLDMLEGEDRNLRRKWEETQCQLDRKSTRLNSSHVSISYAVFCSKKKSQ